MAKIKNPARFSEYFKVAPSALSKLGVLNPTLNVDTRLFIDPLLLEASAHSEICDDGRKAYVEHFRTAISLLQKVKVTDNTDVAWRNVRRLLSFPEIKGTCLGYGAESISGSGSGEEMTGQVLTTAKAIVDLGIQDPDLFVALALFEDNFGPDRISDMTTNIICGALLKFNERVLPKLKVPTEEFNVRLKNGAVHKARLPRNPLAAGDVPVILVPTDILRDLLRLASWSGPLRHFVLAHPWVVDVLGDIAPVAVVAVGMWESLLSDFHGLWEGWENSFIVFPCFPSDRHIHRLFGCSYHSSAVVRGS